MNPGVKSVSENVAKISEELFCYEDFSDLAASP